MIHWRYHHRSTKGNEAIMIAKREDLHLAINAVTQLASSTEQCVPAKFERTRLLHCWGGGRSFDRSCYAATR
jgi:hypothetical protein